MNDERDLPTRDKDRSPLPLLTTVFSMSIVIGLLTHVDRTALPDWCQYICIDTGIYTGLCINLTVAAYY